MLFFRKTLPGILLLFVLGSCSDSSTDPVPQTHGTIGGKVTAIGTDEPLAGATVLLATEQFIILQAISTGNDGSFSFENTEAGSLLLFALKESYMMAEASSSLVNLQGGQTWTTALRMMESPEPLVNHHITGRVTNAATGDAVAGAWIASIGLGEAGNSIRYLTENNGSISIAVSDEEGNYNLPVFGVTEGMDGPVIGLSPISIGCQGFRPRTFAGEGPDFSHENWQPGGLLPAPADSVLHLDIQLEAIPQGGLSAEEVGTVKGVIVNNGQPQGGVLVTMTLMALADRDTVFDPSAKVSIDGGSVFSNLDGSFEMKLEPGFYALRAGLMPNDGWCRDAGLSNLEVVADVVADVGNISVGAAIAPLTPAAASRIVWNNDDGQAPTLTWTPIEGAEYYLIKANFNSPRLLTIGSTTETTLDWPQEFIPPQGTTIVRWMVYAVYELAGIPGTRFSWFEVPATFTFDYDGEKD